MNLKIGNKYYNQTEKSGKFNHNIQIVINGLDTIKNKALKYCHVDTGNSDIQRIKQNSCKCCNEDESKLYSIWTLRKY